MGGMLLHKLTILLLCAFALSVSASRYRPPYTRFTSDVWTGLDDYNNKAREIREAFRIAWHQYVDYAYPNGTVPLSNGSFVEDPPAVFHDTTVWDQPVHLSDATIHYLGGLISSYDLAAGAHRGILRGKSATVILDQAETLARTLLIAFDTPSGMPDPVVTFYPFHERSGANVTTLHNIGSLMLEWTRLGDISTIKEFGEVIQKIDVRLGHPMPRQSQPFTGLFSNVVNLTDGWFLGEDGGWNAEGLVYYESLIKLWEYDPIRFVLHKERWTRAADSVMANLRSYPDSNHDLTFLSDFTGNRTITNSSRPACASGSNFISGGMAVEGEKHANIWPDSPGRISAAELVEVLYNAWRATDDSKWQDRAWELYKHLNTLHGAKGGTWIGRFELEWDYSDRMDFEHEDPITREGVWMGRILRTMWLMLASSKSPTQTQRADKGNRFIYTTGGHPIQVYNYGQKADPHSPPKDNLGGYTDWKYAQKNKHQWRPESWESFFKGVEPVPEKDNH
ncbi:hypothetical protein G7Z17_g7413 [Cylindrodendrum hubeiense]|uniref:mannosyl-oligosaccharide 1,2-alpha-mannosidase n=1 Tax=Cylindrodendrum hubeiense TaxID=595255 RepID=A0A9P5L9Y1_9HYPO|nr:hypothetical protein G7Z17_g7413 [Cylindrodendrum hubeiense]